MNASSTKASPKNPTSLKDRSIKRSSHESVAAIFSAVPYVIPHVTEAIKERLYRIADQTNADIVISEIGGTIGDIESLPFIEAARQFMRERPADDVCFVHVTLVPYIAAAHEVKTKPTQHSVKELRSLGVQPDFIVCRSDHEISCAVREKIALFCDVAPREVLSCTDAPSIYEVPIMLAAQDFDVQVLEKLDLPVTPIDLSPLQTFLDARAACKDTTDIAIVGKYVSLPDAYLSIIEALHHAGIAQGTDVEVHLIDGEELSPENADELLGEMQGILVPGGFGQRAFEARSKQHAMHANTAFRSSESALVCKRLSVNLPAM